MTRVVMRRAGLIWLVGICTVSVRACTGRSASDSSNLRSRRRNLPLATGTRHRWKSAHLHTVIMASSPTELHQITSPSRATRMGAILVGMGALHFVAPKPFDSIVPAELPGSQRFYTYASGVGEVTTGALLLVPRTRRLGALAAVALFVSVFPANVNMVRLWKDKPLFMRIGAIARLPLQIPMIIEALKIYRSS